MNSWRLVGRPGRADILLDAGPLQTIFLFHYIEQTRQFDTGHGGALIRKARPKMAELGNASPSILGKLLAAYKRRYYTQSGLAEALRFREHSRINVQRETIRRFGLDAITSQDFVEIRPSPDQLANSAKLIYRVGLTDAIHIHLLERDADMVLLTDDGRLRQHAGYCADRILVLDEILDFEQA